QIDNNEVKKELLERARTFVRDYYQVDEEALKKDMTFMPSKKTKTEKEDGDDDEFDDFEEEEFEEVECEDDHESDDDELYEDDDSETKLVGVLRVKIDRV